MGNANVEPLVKRSRAWKIIDRGSVSDHPRMIDFSCPRCGWSGAMPVDGIPMAQLADGGLVFDPVAEVRMPKEIQCKGCRAVFEGGRNAE